jgi:predicted 3-demethylubiquinone-9 3-methyltransferase (glyoxalase superfamily)
MKPQTVQKITPFLWFNTNAEEAVNFYVSAFSDGKIHNTIRYTEGAPMPAGTVLTMEFTINGQDFVALNGGPHYQFTPAVSFVINCATQEEVDYYWSTLTADGGTEVQCGWLVDRFGISWQVVPTAMFEFLGSSDRVAAQRATTAMYQMKKLDLPALRRAFEGK